MRHGSTRMASSVRHTHAAAATGDREEKARISRQMIDDGAPFAKWYAPPHESPESSACPCWHATRRHTGKGVACILTGMRRWGHACVNISFRLARACLSTAGADWDPCMIARSYPNDQAVSMGVGLDRLPLWC
eukprot:32725-Chlamydomonas_euryale.AAC.7